MKNFSNNRQKHFKQAQLVTDFCQQQELQLTCRIWEARLLWRALLLLMVWCYFVLISGQMVLAMCASRSAEVGFNK